MVSFTVKLSMLARRLNHGFTLIELILVIIILGIMSAGISGFITLSTQSYLNASSRDELIGNARFVVERLNRELRNAVPNSIRIASFDNKQCIEFTPIVASSTYTDIPVLPEPASKTLSVIPFIGPNGGEYQCSAGCGDLVTVYPLNSDDIYDDYTNNVKGKIFSVDNVDTSVEPWQLNILNSQDISFDEDSPTQRLYIVNEQVSYCAVNGFIIRYTDDVAKGGQTFPSLGSEKAYMAGYLVDNVSLFNYQPPTLRRNAVVQIHLPFSNNGENYVFDHEVHIKNVP